MLQMLLFWGADGQADGSEDITINIDVGAFSHTPSESVQLNSIMCTSLQRVLPCLLSKIIKLAAQADAGIY